MIGGGFLKAMKDAVDYNRSLLGYDPDRIYSRRKRTRREKLEGGPVDQRHVEGILLTRRKFREYNFKLNRVASLILLTLFFVTATAIIVNYLRQPKRVVNPPEPVYFVNSYAPEVNGLVTLTQYYVHGSKAAETRMKDGKKHQQSESFYQTGEQFRSALYYYDTLVREVYRYRDGDTIKNFPRVTMDQVYHVTIPVEGEHPGLRFDFLDGKILLGTYREFR